MKKQEQTEYWERMTKYFSNELSMEEKSSFEKWAQKIDNQNLFNEMNTNIKQMDEAGYLFTKTTDQAWAELHTRIQEDAAVLPSEIKYPLYKTLYRVAATIIIVFGLSWSLVQLTKTPSETLATKYAQSEITLPDGSVVSLNANSSLVYPKAFKGDSRKVELIGEAYFDIAPNPDKPFIITADNAEIKVLGTKFNVITNKELNKVEVLVESGVVSLSLKNNIENSVLLKKGEFGILKDNVIFESQLSNPNYLSWKTKVMDFRNENLHTVLEVVNHTYGTHIVLESEPLKDLKLTSKYNNINLDTIVQSICIAFDLKKYEINDQIILANKGN